MGNLFSTCTSGKPPYYFSYENISDSSHLRRVVVRDDKDIVRFRSSSTFYGYLYRPRDMALQAVLDDEKRELEAIQAAYTWVRKHDPNFNF